MRTRKIVPIPVEALDNKSLTYSDIVLLAQILRYASKFEVYTIAKLKTVLNMSENTIRSGLRKLTENGFLERNPAVPTWSLPHLNICGEEPQNLNDSTSKIDGEGIKKCGAENEEERTKEEDKDKDIYNNTLSESFLKVAEREEKENTIVQPDSEEKIQEKEKRKRRVFVKPTLEEIQAYCKERESTVSATAFYDWYESNGWMVGRHHMVDWKASVRTWEQKDRAAGRYIVPPENRSNEKKEAMSEVCPF